MSHDRFDVINNSSKTKRKIGTMTGCFSRNIYSIVDLYILDTILF
jgi:hypothetical protein